MELSDERAVVGTQIEIFSTMIDQIEVLLKKAPDGYDQDLVKALRDGLEARKTAIKGLIGQSKFFLAQIDGIELACRCRNGNKRN